jgi:hypothetical protein
LDAVLLVHGTFAYHECDEATSDPALMKHDPPRWWQRGSEFVRHMNDRLVGVATCWPVDVCAKLPWSKADRWTGKTRYKYRGRELFAWSGENSDSARRAAAERLLDGLVALEREERDYHLVGHSHGGTVIWLTLQLAVTRGVELTRLRSWTTLGTPFPSIEATRFSWFTRPLLAAASLGIAWATGLMDALILLADPRSMSYVLGNGLSWPTRIAIVLLALLCLAFVGSYIFDLVRRIQAWRERDCADKAWKQYGSRWLGLFSRIDEAIAGTQLSVGLYTNRLVRINWPSMPRPAFRWTYLAAASVFAPLIWLFSGFGWPATVVFGIMIWRLPDLWWLAQWAIVPVMNHGVLPLAEWVVTQLLRAKTQSADRTRTSLTYISPEPVFHENPRGPLWEPLAGDVARTAQRAALNRMTGALAEFAEKARGPADAPEALSAFVERFQLSGELVHNAYPETPSVRNTIAAFIHRSSRLGGRTAASDPTTRERLERQPGEAVGPFPPRLNHEPPGQTDYRPWRKPSETTPLTTRMLLAGGVLFLVAVAFVGLHRDMELELLRNVVRQVHVGEENDQLTQAERDVIVKINCSMQRVWEPRLREMLVRPEPDRRIAAAYLLGQYPQLDPATIQALQSVRDDWATGRHLRAAILLSLSQHGISVVQEWTRRTRRLNAVSEMVGPSAPPPPATAERPTESDRRE